jgi:thiol-disulfide isomerase/thioredoxin
VFNEVGNNLKFIKMKHCILLVVPLFFLHSFDLFSQGTDQNDNGYQEMVANTLIGKHVPDFTASTLALEMINQDSLRGSVTLLHFALIGCAPCLLEIPYLNGLSAKYKDKGFKVMAVFPNRPIDILSFENPVDTNSVFAVYSKVSRFEKIKYTILTECLTNDVKVREGSIGVDCNQLSKVFMRESYPTCYLIDRKGIIRDIFTGFDLNNRECEITEIEAAVIDLLKE